jgi:hypothetical protein
LFPEDSAPGETDEDRERRQSRNRYLVTLDKMWKGSRECPICKDDNWGIADLIEAPIRNLTADVLAGIVHERQGYVYVPVGCLTCGYTMFFHSGVLDSRGAERWRL